MRTPQWLWIGSLLCPLGCAQMHVTKVPADKRATDADAHVKGFRYYLSRPYVVVKEPIEVSSETSLIVLEGNEGSVSQQGLGSLPVEGGDVTASRLNPATGTLDLVAADELSAIRDALARQAGRSAMVAASGPAGTAVAAPQTVAAVGADVVGPRLPTVAAAGLRQPVHTDVMDVRVSVPVEGPSAFATYRAADQVAEASTRRGTYDLDDISAPKDTDETSVDLAGKVEVVFLPDLDEQYAVDNRNCLSQSSYGLGFRDGWQLTGVNGQFDSTPVAIELLNTIDSAIGSAKALALQRLQTAEQIAKVRESLLAGKGKSADARDGDTREYALLEVRRTRLIPPGVYRINKPWEAGPAPTGCGLLAKLGFSMIEVVSVNRAEARKADEK